MYLIRKYRDIEAEAPLVMPVKVGGQYKFILRDLMGRAVYETDWRSNLVVNQGLDTIGYNRAPMGYNVIGTSNVPLDQTQTQLGARVSEASMGFSSVYEGSPDYALSKLGSCRHGAVTAYTIRETGQAFFLNYDTIYCRHLVEPEIPKGIYQSIDVLYKHTVYPFNGDIVDNTGNVVLDGVQYSTLIRRRRADNTILNGAHVKMAYNTVGTGSSYANYWDGDIGATITDSPSGTSQNTIGSVSYATYVNGNHYNDCTITAGLTQGNFAGDAPIRTHSVPFNCGPIQCQFDSFDIPGTGIPKDPTKTMTLSYRISWDRYTP